MDRHTKIIATVGPASNTAAGLRALIAAGIDIFRLNFSHGSLVEKTELIRNIRTMAAGCGKIIAILADLQGPKIRVGLLRDGMLQLLPGTKVTLTTRDVVGKAGVIPTTYRGLPADVKENDRILLDDGSLELQVKSISGPDIECLVLTGGILRDHKGINLPGISVSAPALTEKDLRDLAFCTSEQVDFIALSFVRKAEDVIKLKDQLSALGSNIPVIAKIEKPEAIAAFDSILAVADAVMVARGDLGVEMNPEKVPLLQKTIISKCNRAGIPVITATQMLESMIQSPRPTRAETSDVANAILDGSDALMLSEETAIGRYPVESVTVIHRVALDIEHTMIHPQNSTWREDDIYRRGRPGPTEVVGKAACRAASEAGAKAILAFTQTGATAALVAKYRPQVPIYAVTPSEKVQRRMCIHSGVYSLLVDFQGNTEAQITGVEAAVLAAGLLQPGDVVVITMGSPLSTPGTTNLLKIHTLQADTPPGN